MASFIIMIFLYFLLLGCAAADSGDDFSNNLFTDLSPLLALFGERVTMQFLSQAMGISDCIILATAPLGIITVVVAAIRVGGPSWLKALIGRATENLAAAELELMSSTSNEVCELWNGNDVVRCVGSAPVWEFICLMPTKDVPKNPVLRVLSMDEAVAKKYMKNTSETENCVWSKIRPLLPPRLAGNRLTSPETADSEDVVGPDEVIIIRNTKHVAPNISHNRYKNTGRGELRLAACFGILLQTGVILYCGLITQYSKIASKFQKDGNPVGRYAFPLTVIGTVVLSIGMFICSHVVESSTKEETFQPMENWRARLVWLQQEKTVGDQEFKSFALYTGEDQPMIITSSRSIRGKETDEPNKSDESDEELRQSPKKLESLTVFGVITSLIGFFSQFIGIRGMHWSVSVASLIAILIMTTVRAWVRRGLAKPMFSESLLPGFELDWFVDHLRNLNTTPWYKTENVSANKTNTGSIGKEITSTNQKETITPDENPGEAQECINRRLSLASLADSQGPVSKEAIAVTLAIEATMNMLHPNPGLNDSFLWVFDIQMNEQEMKLKTTTQDEQEVKFEITGREGKWKANAGEIEAALSLRLFYIKSQHKAQSSARPPYKSDDFSNDTWLRGKGDVPDVGIRILGPHTISLLRHLDWWVPADGPQIWKGEVEEDKVSHTNGARSEQVDAIEYMTIEESRVVGLDPRRYQSFKDSQKAMTDAVSPRAQGQSGDPLGETINPSSERISISEEEDPFNGFDPAASIKEPTITATSHLQFSWPYYHKPQCWNWKFRLLEEESKDSSEEESEDALEKESEDSSEKEGQLSAYIKETDNGLLIVKSLDSLEILYAKDMFSTFMSVVVESLEDPIGGNTDIKTSQAILDNQDTWRHLALRNDDISRLAEDIQNTGLCNTHDAYISIISPLSMQQKLPEAATMVELVRNYTKEFEERHQWLEAGNIYWQLSLHLVAFTGESYAYVRAVATLMMFRKTLRSMIERERVVLSYRTEMSRYMNLGNWLEKAMGNVDTKLVHNLTSLDKLQDADGWHQWLDDITRDGHRFYPESQRSIFCNSANIYENLSFYGSEKEHARAKDIFDRTALHYCAAFTGHRERGYQEWNSDHVSRLSLEDVRHLIEQGADINARDIRGWTPLHYACCCAGSTTQMARLLLEKGASVNVQGREGTAPIHCAAEAGHIEMVEILLEFGANIDIADGFGNTALHEAAIKGFAEIVNALVNRGCRKPRDARGRAAIHLAAIAGQDTVIDQLDLAEDINSKDYDRCTPFYLAAKFGHKDFLQRLAKLPQIDINTTGGSPNGDTPLHVACMEGHDECVASLLDLGAAIDVLGDGGHTPLISAVYGKKESTVKLLTARGANVKYMNEGYTALHAAEDTGNTDIFDHLLKEGADIHAGAGSLQGTPLHAASRRIDDNPLIQRLIDLGAAIDETDDDGNTPLHIAISYGKPANIRLLVENGANKEARNIYDNTPLLSTTTSYRRGQEQRKESFRLLIRLGAEVNVVGRLGRTLLHQVAEDEELASLIPELLDAGARIGETDGRGSTALHWAVGGKCTEGIKLLVEHGANVEAVNGEGETPHMIAERVGLSDWWRENIPPSKEWWRVSSANAIAQDLDQEL